MNTNLTTERLALASRAERLFRFPEVKAVDAKESLAIRASAVVKRSEQSSDLNKQEAVRLAAERQIRKAVVQVVAMLEAETLAKRKRKKRKDEDDTIALDYATVVLATAAAAAFSVAAPKLATLARGEDRGDVVTEHEENAFEAERSKVLGEFPRSVADRLEAAAKQVEAEGNEWKPLSKAVRSAGEAELETEKVSETESQSVYGAAQLRALKRAGFATKIWMTMEDDHVRPTHVRCGEQGEVAMNKPFSNGLQYPGDPHGGPEEVINCRCFLSGGTRNRE